MRGDARASSGGLRFVLLALLAAGLLMIPAARASAADFSLTIEEIGSGSGTVTCEVEGTEESCAPKYEEGTEVTVLAFEDPGSTFVEFSGDCGPLACEVVMDQDHVVAVEFDLNEFNLTIDTDGSGSGKVECELQEGPKPCEPTYPEGAEVTLVPDADPGSEFVEFSGSACSGLECELIMEEDSSVTATFDLIGPALTVVTAGTGSGTVKCAADGGPFEACAPAYLEGTELVLAASANPGSQFAGWSGACTTDPCKPPPLEEDALVIATFNLVPAGTGGGSSGGSVVTKTPPPPPGKLSVSGAALYRAGKAMLRVSCKGRGACKGSLKLMAKLRVRGKLENVEIGRVPFSLAAATSKTLKVRLSAAAKKVLGKAKAVKATASGAGVVKSTVTIKPTAR